MNKKRIIVKMIPFGMCNQLFMYAYGRFLSEKLKEFSNGKVILDYSNCLTAHHNATWENTLYNFNLNVETIIFTSKDFYKIAGLKGILLKILEKLKIKRLEYGFSGKLLRKLGIIINSNGDMHEYDNYYSIIPKSNVILCKGLFQNPIIMKEIRQILISEINIKNNLAENDNVYTRTVKSIHESNSVAIHVRRGDYVKNSLMEVCDDSYYLTAIDTIKEKVQNPVFYVFSDDIQYTRNLFKLKSENDLFVFVSSTWTDYEELTLMKECKHFIISNSSFSWWGQFLSDYNNKIVISPNRWFKESKPNSNHMSEPDWILL